MGSACGCVPGRAGPSSLVAAPRAARGSPRSRLGPTDVRGVLRSGKSLAAGRVILYVARRAGPSEVAFVVSRRVGGAVARNRARRIMRAAWREVAPSVGGDLEVVFV